MRRLLLLLLPGAVLVGCASGGPSPPLPAPPTPRAGAPTLTACLWLTPGGRSCSPRQWQRVIFYRRPSRLRGCRPTSRAPVWAGHGRRVALTFDDGPSLYTPAILEVLRRQRVTASFFLVGQQVERYPQLVRRELRAGHLIANHSWDHALLTTSRADLPLQTRWPQAAIRRASGFTPCLMRPPYGAWNRQLQRAAARLGLQLVLWNVDTGDWARPGVEQIVQRALAAPSGAIILMHDGGGDRSQTLAALPAIIRGLRGRGLQLVSLSQLLHLQPRRAQ